MRNRSRRCPPGTGLLSAVSADEFTPDDATVWQVEETDRRDVQADGVNAPLMLWRADFVE